MGLLRNLEWFPELLAILRDTTVSNAMVVEIVNARQQEFSTTESSVRRARGTLRSLNAETVQHRLMPGSMAVPEPEVQRPRNRTIQGWTPGKVLVGKETYEIRTEPEEITAGSGRPVEVEVNPDEERILTAESLDPELWEIVSYRRNHWQVGLAGVWLEGWRVTARKRDPTKLTHVDTKVEEWLKPYLRRADRTAFRKQTGDMLVVPVGDLQIGKVDTPQ